MIKMLNWLAATTQTENLCLGGGSFMNTLLNGKISQATPFKNVFIPFAPDDAGNALGAPMYVNKKATPLLKPYLTDSFTNDDIAACLDKYKLGFKQVPDDTLLATLADRLAAQKVIGWMQGAMEFGQRALGNRSILASPQHAAMKDRVNAAVKYREHFRPFAPAILHEHGDRFFHNYVATPYMERVLPFRRDIAGQVAAVVHADGTGRVQSVTPESNGKYYALINAFAGKTGIPMLLNTSFNRAGEPIVYTPDDALRTFYTSGIDILVMGNTVIEK
jgi:carbamoyltransferase